MKSELLIEQMVESPELPFVIHRLQAILEAERSPRERFYQEITEDRKVEFIHGKVHVQSPARLKHIEVSGRGYMLLKAFTIKHRFGLVTSEKALVSLTRNDYEPDLCFFGPDKAQKLTPRQLKFPPPDWVCEVLSDTTERIDREVKFQDYALHGIDEYWMIDCEKEQVEVYFLSAGSYQLREIVDQGPLEIKAIPGFRMEVRSLFDDSSLAADLQAILA